MMRWVVVLVVALSVPVDGLRSTSDEDRATERRRAAIERMNAGVDAFAEGDLASAIEALQHAIELDPGYSRAHVNLGRLHAKLTRPDEAQAELERALELVALDDVSELRAEIHYDLGLIHLGRGSLRQAASAFEQATVAAPRDYLAHHQRGVAYDLLDDAAEADRSYRACIDIQADYAPCWTGLARLYFDFGEPLLATSVLEAATKSSPTDAALWLAFAELHLNLERPQQAVDAGKTAQTIDPDLVDVDYVLGMAYAELRMREEARERLGWYMQRQIAAPPARVRSALDVLVWLHDPI